MQQKPFTIQWNHKHTKVRTIRKQHNKHPQSSTKALMRTWTAAIHTWTGAARHLTIKTHRLTTPNTQATARLEEEGRGFP